MQVVDALVDAIQGTGSAASSCSPSRGLVEVPLAEHTVELLRGAAGAQVELDEQLLQVAASLSFCASLVVCALPGATRLGAWEHG